MHIKKIELRNFKSFRKKTEIPFEKGFTVISGPNGSGKSNIIDSILFCLGLSSSTKALRADRLTDLIHNASDKKEAEVTIVFDDCENIADDKEIAITRKVKITDKGYYSYYYINKKQCSLNEIHRILEKAGIFEDSLNIIMQGDITRIVEMTPFQRRKIIDDISGISEFDEKKEKAIQELETVKENIDRINTILIEVESRLKQLEKDKDEALRYKRLIEEKKVMEKELLAHKRIDLLKRVEKIKRDITTLEREKDETIHKLLKVKKSVEELNYKLEGITKKISEKTDERFKELQEELTLTISELESARREGEFYKKEIKKLEEEKFNLLVEISKLKDEINSIRKEIEKLLLQKISVEETIKNLESQLDFLMRKLSQADERNRDLRDELISLKNKLEVINEKRNTLLREKDVALESLRRISIEIEELEAEKERISLNEKEILKKIEELRIIIETLERDVSSEIKLKNEIDSKIFSLRDQISSIEEKIKHKELELAKVRVELSTAQTSYGKAVELILEAKEKKALPGIYGVVSQLGEVDKEYALALEIAAGNALNFIVVENEDDAVRAINYLKQIKGGRATFLPLNKIKKNFSKIKLENGIIGESGVIDYAVNLVRCDSKFKPIFNFIFRDTVVVDKIENAKRIMDGRRIVTLEGDLIEKSGAITGGSVDKRRSSFFVVKELIDLEKRLSEEITILNSKKASLFGELRKIENMRKISQDRIGEIEKRIIKFREDLSSHEAKISELKTRIKEIEERIKKKNEERKEIYENVKRSENYLKELEEDMNHVISKIEDVEKRLKGSEVSRLNEELEKLKSEYQIKKETFLLINGNLEKEKIRLEKFESVLNEKERRVSEIEQTIAQYEKFIKESEEKSKELERRVEELRKVEKAIDYEVRELRIERDSIMEEIKKLEGLKTELEYKITSIEEKIKARKDTMRDVEYEISNIPEIRPSMRKEDAVRRLEEIERSLANFGDVNLKAIQEYEDVKYRRDELLSRKLILEKEREEIFNRIAKYEKMKKDVFFETFNAINNHFEEIISELTGGEGTLYLDNFEDPFNSGLHMKLKLYNKPTQKLESMSGGEKSLIALAFILAIQRFKPAPFYAFDEIDMFLDGVNVARVAKLIKKMSKNAQFIVVSLRKPMLEEADAIVGVTLGRDNTSIVTGIRK